MKPQKIVLVISISGLLAMVGGFVYFSQMASYRLSALQSEARVNLQLAYVMMMSEGAERGSFEGVQIDDLSLPQTDRNRYQYVVLKTAEEKFLIEARSQPKVIAPCADEDVWTIDHDKNVVHVRDGLDSCN